MTLHQVPSYLWGNELAAAFVAVLWKLHPASLSKQISPNFSRGEGSLMQGAAN